MTDTDEVEIKIEVKAGGRSFPDEPAAREWLRLLAWARGHTVEHYRLSVPEAIERRARQTALAIEDYQREMGVPNSKPMAAEVESAGVEQVHSP